MTRGVALEHSKRDRRAFSLIELLVVIAIIVLLIGILLPSLASAREAGRTTVCLSNMKQIGVGLVSYAGDYKGQIWESGHDSPFRFWYAQPTNPLLATTNMTGNNPTMVGPALQYLTNTDRIFACPTNKRKAAANIKGDPNDPYWQAQDRILQVALFNEFLTPRQINFDYTMVTGASGARVDSDVLVGWDTRSRQMTGETMRTQPPGNAIQRFRAVPVYVEEDSEWWNGRGPDGMCSNLDQFTDRHGKKGHLLLANGDVEAFKAPRGKDNTRQTDVGDMVMNDIWVRGRNAWHQVAPSWPANLRGFGWINSPR